MHLQASPGNPSQTVGIVLFEDWRYSTRNPGMLVVTGRFCEIPVTIVILRVQLHLSMRPALEAFYRHLPAFLFLHVQQWQRWL